MLLLDKFYRGDIMGKKEMTNCKACNQELAKGVKKCIHCGKDQRNFFMKHKVLSGILILGVLATIGSNGSEEEQPVINQTNEPQTETNSSSTAVESPELSIGDSGSEEEQPVIDQTNEPQTETNSSSIGVESPEQNFSIGDSVTVGKFEFMVNTSEEMTEIASGNEFIDNITTEGKFIVVNVTVKNNDTESRMVDGSMFTIVDNQGRKFSTLDDLELVTILENEYIFLDSINPGMSLTGTFVFEVPSDIEDYTLQVSSGVGFTFGKYETINLK